MIVTIQQVQTGVAKYIENEIAKKATGFKKFSIYFIMPQIVSKIASIGASDNDMVKIYLDENGNVKLDDLYATAKDAIRRSGQFELYGIIFNENDVDSVYSYIKNTTI